MADLSGGSDRGQLILVTALVIAAVLVALVLLVNAAIYTENLATRTTDSGERDALGHRGAVVQGVGGIVDRENAAEYDDRVALEANVTDGVETLGELLFQASLEDGAAATLNSTSMHQVNGALVRQTNGSRAFLNESDSSDWRVANDVNRTRRFSASVNRTGLNRTTADSPGSAFHVVLVVDGSTDEWHAYVYENSDDNIAVAVKNASETDATEVCSSAAETATVGFTAGTLSGEDCPGLDWANGLSGRYDVEFRNGAEATGTYELTVRTEDAGALATGNLVDGTAVADPDSPYWVPAVYAVEVGVAYESPSLTYRAPLRVAPGEPRD